MKKNCDVCYGEKTISDLANGGCKRCPHCKGTGINPEEKKIDKAKRELKDFTELIKEVWDEDFTDEKELLCLKFYKTGIKIAENPDV